MMLDVVSSAHRMLESHVYFYGVDIDRVPAHHERAGFKVSWLLHPADRAEILSRIDPALPPPGVSFEFPKGGSVVVLLFNIPCRIDRDRRPGTVGLALEEG